jgi:hypothetical protein
MILDERLEFADAVSVAGSVGTTLVGDVIDLGLTSSDIGNGDSLYLVIQTDTEIITAGTAGTIKFQLVTDSTSSIAVDGTASVHFDTGTLVTDDALANDPRLNVGGIIAAVELPIADYERYLGVLCTIGGHAVTAGKINAFLTPDVAKWVAYPDGI